MTLIDKMKLMGAEETEMLKLNSQSTILETSQSGRKLPVSEQSGSSSGNGNGNNAQLWMNSIQTEQPVALWGDYTESRKQEDELLAPHNHPTTGHTLRREIVVNDVYQPTILADGKRIGGGSRVTQQLHMSYSHAARASMSGQEPLTYGLGNLSLGNYPHQDGNEQSLVPLNERMSCPSITKNRPPSDVPPKHHEGRTSRKNPASTGCRDQNDPSQQAPSPQHFLDPHSTIRNTPIQPSGELIDLLTDPLPKDSSPLGRMHSARSYGISGSYQTPVQDHLLAYTQAQVDEDGQLDGDIKEDDREDWLIDL